jgi:predicted nucleic acid-binding protein
MAGYILDTSSLLTLIEGEAGATRVEEVLRTEKVFISWVALLELRYVNEQRHGVDEADMRHLLVTNLKADILWNADEPLLLTAARFKAAHRISLGDSIISASAHRLDATLLHKDREFESLAGLIKLESL